MTRIFLTVLLLNALSATAQKTYFQQRADTRISVRLDDVQHTLHGYEELRYTNHSPDTLTFLYIHLWPNAYLNDRTPYAKQQMLLGNKDFFYAKEEDRGYIDSLSFRVDDKDAAFETLPGAPDIARLNLPQPLLPGQMVEIETPFRVKVPKIFSRLGHSGQAYYISQWFPKPAVYDARGWHPMSYLDQGEFYSEFGSYEVSITLPKNYVVLATGNCVTAEENDWMRMRLRTQDTTKKTDGFPLSDPAFKTITFKEDNIHDFAWFADKRYLLSHDTARVADHLVDIWTAYLPASQKTWRKSTDYLKTTLEVYGSEVGPYPYKTIKAVEGDMKAGGGMEYPTVTIIDQSAAQAALADVLVHEAGHNWFYGILGSNERTFPWLDEGVNSFYEQKTTERIRHKANQSGSFNLQDLTSGMYYQQAAIRQDQPANLAAPDYRDINYGASVYAKTPLLLRWLEVWMGEDKFRAAMHEYYQTWQFRHPYPEDMQAIFQKHSQEDVSWFFTGALATDQPIDFKVKRHGDHYVVRNNSGFTAPAVLEVWQDGKVVRQERTRPFADTVVVRLAPGERLSLHDAVPDLNEQNNGYGRGGFRAAIGLGLGRQKKETLYLLPALGYNAYDGFMLGLLLHNISLPEHRFKYALAPMWGFGSKAPAGAGSLSYTFYPKKTFQEITAQVDLKSFHYNESNLNISEPLFARYLKAAPSVNFIFKENNPVSTVKRTLGVRGYFIEEEGFSYAQSPADSLYRPVLAAQQNTYGRLRYEHRNDRLFNPFRYEGSLVAGETFATLSVEGNIKIDYDLRGKAFYARVYGGKFFSFTNDPYANSRYALSMTSTADNDYLYDELFFGRSEREGFAAHQVVIKQGGFKIPTPLYAQTIGQSDDWLTAINLKTDLPLGPLPLRLFFDAGTFGNAARLNPSGSKILFAGGLELHLLDDFLTIHLPLVMSEDYRDYFKSVKGRNNLFDAMTFSLKFNGMGLLKVQRSALRLLGR